MKTEQVDYLTDKNVMYLTNSLEFKKTGIIENKDFYLLKITDICYDEQAPKKEALENVDGVKGVFEASGQLQIILGTGTVNKVFAEFIDIAGITASSKAEAKEAAAEKQNLLKLRQQVKL